jgi:hypothetical protein
MGRTKHLLRNASLVRMSLVVLRTTHHDLLKQRGVIRLPGIPREVSITAGLVLG